MINDIKRSPFLELDKEFYSKVEAEPLLNPFLLSANTKLADELNIDKNFLDSKEFIELVNGEHYLDSFASAYSGHQFGYFVPNLGDGRALNLGELNGYHLQLKGSGKTPYSREGDGRAVLRSSIREYLVSEAMYALSVPTTRAMALIGSDTKVYRERVEKGAIVLRASRSWIRFGSFEFAYLGKNKKERIKMLADHVIANSFFHLKDTKHRYEELFFEIADKTAELMSHWQSIGFMHGVMNTDNMSIEGLTIDYGPYAFMEIFDRGFICNLSDYEGRYSFENQPFIARWNLGVLAKMFEHIADKTLIESYLDTFIGKYKELYFQKMFKKLGLGTEFDDDNKLLGDLLKALEIDSVDYTSFFYNLSLDNTDDIEGINIQNWIKTYKQRVSLEDRSQKQILADMQKVNPKYILRNYMLQEAISLAEIGDFTLVNDLLKIVQNPYDQHKGFERFCKPDPMIETLRCSCSS